MFTTINRLKLAGARLEQFEHLLVSLGYPNVDLDAPITLEYILGVYGIDEEARSDLAFILLEILSHCDLCADVEAVGRMFDLVPYVPVSLPNLASHETREYLRYALMKIRNGPSPNPDRKTP